MRGRPALRLGVTAAGTVGTTCFLGLPGWRFAVATTSATSTTSIADLAAGNSSSRFLGTRVNLEVVAIGCTNASSSQGSGTISDFSISTAGAATSGSGCSVDAGIEMGVEGL